MNSEFARNITLLRKERKISQKQAAADLGISQALLSHYEKGVRECGLNFLMKAADYYNVTCDFLLGRSGNSAAVVGSQDENDEDLNRRIINNSVNHLIDTAHKAEKSNSSAAIISILMMTVYKLLRIVGKNNKEFKVPEASAESCADALISVNQAKLIRDIGGDKLEIDKTPSVEKLIAQSESGIRSLLEKTEQ
jgi:transcriptional regulator with XRE-family HTH domain